MNTIGNVFFAAAFAPVVIGLVYYIIKDMRAANRPMAVRNK